MFDQSANMERGRAPTSMNDARESAHRALFSAASRVLKHHAAALDAKVDRIKQSAPERDAHQALNSSPANG